MSNKPRSQRSSASAPDDNSSNRRARRKDKERTNANAEAGPSGSQVSAPSKPPSKNESRRAGKERAAVDDNSFAEADFIPFSFSDPEEDDAPAKESSPPPRDGEERKGKGKARANGRESEHAGRKRKADEVDLNDGYTSKKERVAAASRKAPWAKDVDWDSCANVAEMYVTGLCCSWEV